MGSVKVLAGDGYYARGFFTIRGDWNRNYNTHIGSNDRIKINDLVCHTTGGYWDSDVSFYIAGDYSEYGNDIIGGDDTIDIVNCEFVTEGAYHESYSRVRAIGEYNYRYNDVVGGNDKITLNNINITSKNSELYNETFFGIWGGSLASYGNNMEGDNDIISVDNDSQSVPTKLCNRMC